MQENKSTKSIGDHIKQISAYGILISSFAIGISIAGIFWSSTVTNLNSELSKERVELKNVTEELAQIKEDYLIYKTTKENGRNELTKYSSLPPLTDTIQRGQTRSAIETKTINTEKSYSFFSGELTISLIATPFEGDPLRHKVLANIASPKGKVILIDKEDIGTVINYTGKNNFEITILEVETFSATFQVRKE